MIWKKYTIETTTEAADVVASILFDNGIVGAEIEDNQNLSDDELKKMYVDIPLEKVDDGVSKVSFYISISEVGKGCSDISLSRDKTSDDKNLVDNSYKMSTDNIFTEEEFAEKLSSIKDGLNEYKDFMDMGSLNITITELDDKVFLNKWKENFKSIIIGDITIAPNWEKNLSNRINILIEPGSAFGTGKHATTKLCIEGLERIISDNRVENVLDIGCGSGILSIIALKLGARNVFAIDIDDSIEQNLLENLKLNDVGKDVYRYKFGNILTDETLAREVGTKKYDIIVANILAPVIVSLIEKGKISSYLNAGGYLILSGIIKEREDDVVSAIKKDDKIKTFKVYAEDEWRMIECKV